MGRTYTGRMNTTILLVLVMAALLVAIVLLVLLLRRPGAPAADPALAAERDRLADELRAERDRVREQSQETGRLNGQLAALQASLGEQRAAAQRFEHALTEARAQQQRLQAEHAEATAHLAHARQANTDMKAFLDEAQTRLSGAFSELAGKVFEEKGQLFEKNIRNAGQQSRTDIEGLLKPFAERIKDFRERVDTLYGEEAKERASLLGAVNELKTLNQDMAGQALALTRALKGNAKVRGDWGELMLESVLRGSGLEEGVHFERQKSTVDDEGARLQPDIVVRLPDERCVVVDSKVNLVAWQEAMNAETPEQQQDAMRRHAVGLRQHMRELSDKNYPKAIGDTALEVTIAFIPIEGALSAALGADPALQTDAFDRRIVFASPNTLMALLRVVERLWTRDKVQKKAIEISDSGGRVLDALMSFMSDFDLVGKRLDDASKAFGNARNRLSESNQAVIPRARRLAELGARGRKTLSEELRPESESPGAAATPALRLIGAAVDASGED